MEGGKGQRLLDSLLHNVKNPFAIYVHPTNVYVDKSWRLSDYGGKGLDELGIRFMHSQHIVTEA